MNTLIQVRANILYDRRDQKYGKHIELILLCDKPTYRQTDEGMVVRERGVEELRLIVSEENLGKLIENLTNIKERTE